MQPTLVILCVVWKLINCVNVPIFVSMDMSTVWPFGNDRFDNPYHLKTDYRNYNDEILNRRSNFYPLVEVGPGSFKAEHGKMPSDYLANQFKKLLALKKKMEENKN